MHTEHFEVRRATVARLLEKWGHITAVGTTSVRTLESLAALAWRIRTAGTPDAGRVVGLSLIHISEPLSGRLALVGDDVSAFESPQEGNALLRHALLPFAARRRCV